jgi:hypothetical protein
MMLCTPCHDLKASAHHDEFAVKLLCARRV